MTIAPATTETDYPLTSANLGPYNTVWPYEAQSDVLVQIDAGSGLVTLTAGVTYTQADAGGGSLSGGGSVTLSASLLTGGAWPSNSVLYLSRSVADDQPSAFGELGTFSPAASEAALDHVAREVQQAQAALGRTLRLRPGETTAPLPGATARAGCWLAFDGSGAPVAVPNAAGTATKFIAASGLTLGFNTINVVTTLAAPVGVTLPDPSTGQPGAFIRVVDGSNNAAANNITVTAAAGVINDHAASAASHVINNSNTVTDYYISDGSWRAIQYGA